MNSSENKHEHGIKDWSHHACVKHNLSEITHTHEQLVEDTIPFTRKRTASVRLEDANKLPIRNKRPLCSTPTSQAIASVPQSKAYTWSLKGCPIGTLPQWLAETPPMTRSPPLKAPRLPPMTSKLLPTEQQSLEQHFQLANEQGEICQNIDKSDPNPYEYLSVDSKVVHYKVPLKRLPRIHRLHGFVGTLKNYCEGIENEIGLPNMEDTGMEHLEDIDIFIKDNTFDMNLLIEDHEDLNYTNTKIYRIASRTQHIARGKAVGLFVNSEGIQFVESVTENTIFVYTDSHIKKEEEDANAIRRLMELIIMRPLIGKVALFHRLQSIAHSEESSEVFSAASLIREFPDSYPDPSSSLITENETTGSDVFYQCIQQKKRNIERLLGEMIALSKRSNLPEEIRPVFEEYQTSAVTEEVAGHLFKLDKAIAWCGFRYRTFYIYVKHNSKESEEKALEEKISTFLTTHGIVKYELIYIQSDLEEYSYIGSMIRPEIQNDHHATLGCFATFKNSNSSSICALISKHFAIYVGNEIFDKDNRLLGRVIPETRGAQGGYDIAAAKTVDKRVLNLDTFFRNYEGEVKRASLIERMDNLQGQPVYLRGENTKLGVGTIEIPLFVKSNGKHHILVSPGNLTLGKPDDRLAEEGDSGAILCLDDLDQNIHVCSMLVGKCGEKFYCFLPLSHGLEELSKVTNGEFKLITHMENSPAQIHAEGDSLQASGSCKYLTY